MTMAEGVFPQVLAFTGMKARGLAGRYGFSGSDADDIAQDLVLDWLVRVRRFDPGRSAISAFTGRIVSNRIATLIQTRQAACRDYRNCQHFLQTSIRSTEGEINDVAETVSADQYEAKLSRSARSEAERTELRIDVASVISLMPTEDARTAILLMSVSGVEAAKRLAISRSTLCRRLTRMREMFTTAGLDRYIGLSCAPSLSKVRREPHRYASAPAGEA